MTIVVHGANRVSCTTVMVFWGPGRYAQMSSNDADYL